MFAVYCGSGIMEFFAPVRLMILLRPSFCQDLDNCWLADNAVRLQNTAVPPPAEPGYLLHS